MNMSFGVLVCLIHDNNTWIGLVEEINIENKDFQVRFIIHVIPQGHVIPFQEMMCVGFHRLIVND